MNELEVSVKWRRVSKRFSLSFAILWNIFLAFIMLMIFSSGSLGMLIFTIPFWIAGGYMLLTLLAQLFNTSYISVNKNYIELEH